VTSDELVRKIQLEMMTTFGWKWGVNVGFHATESMKYVSSTRFDSPHFQFTDLIDRSDDRHVHLHVISNEMISPSLKNKKHYNSFHPNAGFFLHLTDVIAETESNSKDRRTTAAYEAILKEPLKSIYNEEEFKTIPKLKAHLELEWENAGVRAKKLIAAASKRKAEGEELERRSKEPKTD
jgi:aprataxin